MAVVPGGVHALAQDGRRIAWLACDGRSLTVHAGVPGEQFGSIDGHKVYCDNRLSQLALAGDSLLWSVDTGGNIRHNGLWRARVGEARARSVGVLSYAYGDGDFFGGIAGDESILVFTTVAMTSRSEIDEATDRTCLFTAVACRWSIVGGRTVRLFGGRAQRMSIRGGVAVAAGNGLVAIARPGSPITVGGSLPGPCACTYTPAWSPDGTQLAFASGEASEGASLYVLDAATRRVRRLTRGPMADLHPSWSPDGTTIAFDRVQLRTGAVTTPEVFTIRADGTGLTRLRPGRDPAWSPDGTRLAFARSGGTGAGIFSMSPQGTSVRPIVAVKEFEEFASPTWSPDSNRIAYVRRCARCARLHVVTVSGRRSRPILTKALPYAVDWSRSGELLLSGELGIFSRTVTGPAEVRWAAPDGGAFASWAPNGGIAFVRPVSRAYEVFASTGATQPARRLTTTTPSAQGSVEVLRAPGGKPVASFRPTGDVHALAVSARVAVALVEDYGRGAILELHSLPGGRLLRAIRLPAHVLSRDRLYPRASLSLAGNRLVYNVGSSIRVHDISTGRTTTLASARALPLDLSIEGDRVVWAENFGVRGGIRSGRGEIRSLTLRR